MVESLEDIRIKKIQKKIWRLRRDGNSWEDIADRINKENKTEYTSTKIQNLYDSYAARSETILSTTKNMRNEAREVSKQYHSEMSNLLEDIQKKIKKHTDYVEEGLDNMYKEGDLDSYYKNVPTLVKMFKNVLDQADSLLKRQKEIQEKQNSVKFTEEDIWRLINKGYNQKTKDTGMAVHPGTGEMIIIDKNNKKKRLEIVPSG